MTAQAIRDSIDVKVEAARETTTRKRAREWEQMSQETRAAWAEFERLRDADFERLEANEAFRRRHERGPKGSGRHETVNLEPYDWKEKPEQAAPRKMVHGIKDDGWN